MSALSTSTDRVVPLPVTQLRRLKLQLAMRVHRLRCERGMTQHQVAEAGALSRATVYLVEAGICDPRLSTITSLAEAIGVEALDLLSPGDRAAP